MYVSTVPEVRVAWTFPSWTVWASKDSTSSFAASCRAKWRTNGSWIDAWRRLNGTVYKIRAWQKPTLGLFKTFYT